MDSRRILVPVVVLALLAGSVVAHVPGSAGDNTSPETAYHIPDAAKSWSIYDDLDGDAVAYYSFELEAGDRLVASTFATSDGPFTPWLVVMGPGIENSGSVPDRVEVPDGMGATVITGEKGGPEYEPFTPTANYGTTAIDRRVDESGRYLLAVYEPDERSGPVGVAAGYQEEFTLVEYLTVPLDLFGVYLWEGDHPLLVFGPGLAVLLGGGALLTRRDRDLVRPGIGSALVLSALLMIATAATVTVQMVTALAATGWTAAALVTVAFIAGPVLFAGLIFRLVLGDRFELTVRTRALLVLVGVGGFVTWAGVLVGPAIAILAALVPRGSIGFGDPESAGSES